MEEIETELPRQQLFGRSRFDGHVGEYIGLSILMFILVVCTLGFGVPWAVCILHEWRMNHLVIDGKQVVFEGRGGRLFWRYVGWYFLTLLTLGFYGFRLPVKMMDWLMERTHLQSDTEENPYYKKLYNKSSFCGVTMDFVRILILQFLLLTFTLGFAMPWVLCMWARWRFDNMIIDGKQVVFEGRGKKLFWRYFVWSLLTLITLGIGGFWMSVKIYRWEAEHTHFE